MLVREWSDSLMRLLREAVPTIWEANGRMGRLPNTMMFVSGNLTVGEVEKKLTAALRYQSFK